MSRLFHSSSSRETAKFGGDFARKILARRAQGGVIIALQGDLGAGKTTFTQGFAKGLGIRRRTASPTFIIMRRFKIPSGKNKNTTFRHLYHIDAYRIKKLDSLEALGLKEIFADPAGIILIEWPEKIKKILPKGAIRLEFQHGEKENERVISLIR
jgi:tRNA threonylcarbamoyladenosine biosynthesis protein TsaE